MRLSIDDAHGCIKPKAFGILSMPTLIRHEGFEVRIYTLDHPPPHVHVFKAGAVVRIDLSTCMVTEIVGDISDRDVKRAEQLVAERADVLQQAWERLHGKT